jgi:hypothetical protein
LKSVPLRAPSRTGIKLVAYRSAQRRDAYRQIQFINQFLERDVRLRFYRPRYLSKLRFRQRGFLPLEFGRAA